METVADAIYHVGFECEDGCFLNEDGNANEQVGDVAERFNYFVNGENVVYGADGDDILIGDAGADELKAWDDNARDTFVFNTGDSGTTDGEMDVVYGFESRQDRIDLTSFDGSAFVDKFSAGGAGEVRFDGLK